MVYFVLVATFLVSTFGLHQQTMHQKQQTRVVTQITKASPAVKPVKKIEQALFLDGIELMNLGEVRHA